jgi:hypothetical protein
MLARSSDVLSYSRVDFDFAFSVFEVVEAAGAMLVLAETLANASPITRAAEASTASHRLSHREPGLPSGNAS